MQQLIGLMVFLITGVLGLFFFPFWLLTIVGAIMMKGGGK